MFGSAVLSLISQDRARVVRWCKVSSSLWNLLTVTSLHVCCGSHSECWETAAEILSNPDQRLLLCAHMMTWAQFQVFILSPKLIPAAKTSPPVGPPSLLGPSLRIWSPSWLQNPPPLNLFKWHAAGLSFSLWDTLLWSDWSSSLGSLCPALRKIAFATKRQTFNEPEKLSFSLLVGFFSSFFLNDGHNYGKKNVMKYAKMCKS